MEVPKRGEEKRGEQRRAEEKRIYESRGEKSRREQSRADEKRAEGGRTALPAGGWSTSSATDREADSTTCEAMSALHHNPR